uniref:Uncharacterized protein n=1 Tax=Arundo donax TaxID=35708 RepID=A0A0A8ZX45_ARUDO
MQNRSIDLSSKTEKRKYIT